jgi:hypothetical protein
MKHRTHFSFFVLALLALTSSAGLAQELRGVMFEMTVSNFNGRSQVVTMGIVEGASTGLDQSLGEMELPPTPPQEIFDARMASAPGKSSLGTGSLIDFRPATPSKTAYTETYIVSFQSGLGGTKVRLEWQNPLPGRITKLTVDGTDVTAQSSIDIPFPTGASTIVVSYNYAPLSFTSLPTSLVFDANNKDPLPTKALEIIPQGDPRAQWVLSSDADWISLGQGDGEGRQTVDVAIQTGIIPTGKYTGIITVRSRFDPAFLDIPVTLNFVVPVREAPLPDGMVLSQNFPNPCEKNTAISLSLGSRAADAASPTLVVSDLTGRVVLDLTPQLRHVAGLQTIVVDPSLLPAGSYTYSLRTASSEVSRTMLVVK